MQSLLLDRAIRRITPLEFATTITETFYTQLQQQAIYGVFPSNCHHNAAVNSLSLDSDHKYLLSGCADSSIKLWDLEEPPALSGKRKFDTVDYDSPETTFACVATIPRKSVHQFGVSCVQWWPYDTGMFISSSFDHTVKVWDTNELTPVHNFDVMNRVYSVDVCGHSESSFSTTALAAVASDQPFIRMLDIRTTSSAHTLQGHKGKTLQVKWHPTNPYYLASGGYDGETKIWDIRRSKACLCRLDMFKTSTTPLELDTHNLTATSVKSHLGPVNGLAWDESGHVLYTAGNDDKVRVWDMVSSMAPPVNKLVNFGPLTRNKYPQTIPLLLSSRQESEVQYLLFPSDNDDVFVYRTADGKLVNRLSRRGSKDSGRTVSMASAGPFSATYYCGTMDGEIIVWKPSWPVADIDDLVEMETENDPASEAREIIANDEYLQKTFGENKQDSL